MRHIFAQAILCITLLNFSHVKASLWREACKQLFTGSKGDTTGVHVAETYAKLKSLAEMETNVEDERLKDKIVELANVGDVGNVANCNVEYFELIDILTREYNQQGADEFILPYLDYCAEKQFLLCRELFAKQLAEGVGDLSKSAREFAQLVKTIFIDEAYALGLSKYCQTGTIEMKDLVSVIYAYNYITGVKYLMPNNDEFTDDISDKVSVSDIRVFGAKCIDVIELEMTQAMKTCLLVRRRSSIERFFDDYTRDWVEKVDICLRTLKAIDLHGKTSLVKGLIDEHRKITASEIKQKQLFRVKSAYQASLPSTVGETIL